MGDTLSTILSLAHDHLFIGDMVYITFTHLPNMICRADVTGSLVPTVENTTVSVEPENIIMKINLIFRFFKKKVSFNYLMFIKEIFGGHIYVRVYYYYYYYHLYTEDQIGLPEMYYVKFLKDRVTLVLVTFLALLSGS